MIIPRINSTSFGDRGGSTARVVGGSTRVGWPGAPGWTIVAGGSACCARDGTNSASANRMAANGTPAHRKRLDRVRQIFETDLLNTK